MSFFSSIQLLNSIFAYTQVCLISFFASIQLLNSIFYPKIKIYLHTIFTQITSLLSSPFFHPSKFFNSILPNNNNNNNLINHLVIFYPFSHDLWS
jgi:hypothetical protein